MVVRITLIYIILLYEHGYFYSKMMNFGDFFNKILVFSYYNFLLRMFNYKFNW